MVALDLVGEMQRRDVESAELARFAKVSRSAVLRLRAGRPGRAATRRRLREALAEFPPVAAVDGGPGAAPEQPAATGVLSGAEAKRRMMELRQS